MRLVCPALILSALALGACAVGGRADHDSQGIGSRKDGKVPPDRRLKDKPRPPADKPRPPADKPRKDAFVPPPPPADIFPWIDAVPPDLKPPPPDMGQPDTGPVCNDPYEPNATCGAAKSLGSIKQGQGWASKSATLNPASDVDWYTAKGVEKNHTCFPGTSQKFAFHVKLAVPAGRRMRVCVYKGSCSGSASCQDNATSPGPYTLAVKYDVKGICALDDDTEARILVQNLGGAAGCAPYTVQFTYKD